MPGRVVVMTNQDTTPIALELHRTQGPIAGTLTDGSRKVEFVGWLSLAAALERARVGEQHQSKEAR